jgi:hypothetical protein
VSSFDIYHPSWEFLEDSQKFIFITRALGAGACGNAEVMTSKNDHSTHVRRPMGTKASKRRDKEEKIAQNVKEALKDTMHYGGKNTNSSTAVLAATFSEFTTALQAELQHWQVSASYSNADPSLRRRYDNLLFMERIQVMERQQGGASTPTMTITDTLQDAAAPSIKHNTTTPSIVATKKESYTTAPSSFHLSQLHLRVLLTSKAGSARLLS